MTQTLTNPTPREASLATLMRAAARVGRSSLATTSGQAYGGARVFRWRAGMLATGRPPGRRRPCWGDGTSGGGGALVLGSFAGRGPARVPGDLGTPSSLTGHARRPPGRRDRAARGS